MNSAVRTRVSRAACCLALAGSLATVGAARAEQVPFYQQGSELLVTLHRSQVLIVADDARPLVERAVQLAESGLTNRVFNNGDTKTYVLDLGDDVTADVLRSLEDIDGIGAALPVVRFPDGTAVGVTGQLVAKHVGIDAATLATEYDLVIDADATATLALKDVTVFTVPDSDPAASFIRAAAMSRDGRLAFAHPDLVIPAIAYQSINDTYFDDQWHLENNLGRGGAELNVLDAWEETMGANIRIGMHDDGCVTSHPDLNPNFTGMSRDIRNNGPIPAGGGHGTAVMGLMAAAANSIGVRGVAPEAEFTASGPLNGSNAQVAGAFTFATNNDVDVHNNSWGFVIPGIVPDIIREAVIDAANDGRDGRGMVITWAAGNSRRELSPGDDLATLDEVIQVGATGQSDTIANYSNFGLTQDIMGPSNGSDGLGLVTTDNPGGGGLNSGQQNNELDDANYTNQMGGTSGAAPVVGGVAALVLGTNPDLNRLQVREILTHTANRVSRQDANYDAVRGSSVRYGFGRVDAGAAVEAAAESLNGNTTWPSVPTDFNVFIFENVDPDVDAELLAQISWDPGGLEVDGIFETDQTQVLVVYRDPATNDDSNFSPNDGTAYNGGDILDPDDGNEVDDGYFVLYFGPVTQNGDRQEVPVNLAIGGGNTDDAQEFLIFAANSRGQFAFGQVIDEEGDLIPRDDAGNDNQIVPPPDSGNISNPELDPGEPGRNNPPSVGANVDRVLGRAPFQVQFYGSVQTPLEVRNRGWSFGDGSSATSDTASHTYSLPGVYNAVFFAENELGISTRLIRIEVQNANGISGPSQTAPPTATIQVLTTGALVAPNASVRFTTRTTGIADNSSDSIVTYDWNFGDGQIGAGQTTENTYSRAGTYIVVVEVTEEKTNGQIVRVSTQQSVVIASSSGPSGFIPTTGQDDPSMTGATGACGATSTGLIMLSLAGLGGMQWTRRRRTR